jgi:hypothetical protein
VHIRLRMATICAGLLVSGCAPPPAAPLGRADCAGGLNDSSRAVCRALDTLRRGFELPSRVLTVERMADTYRIRTVPADPNTLDGMGLVIVGPGDSIRSVVVSDSL